MSCSAPNAETIKTRVVPDDRRLANLQRASTLPWKDDGYCAVREASDDWAELVRRCYDALDTTRLRFSDRYHQCPIAQADVAIAGRLVAICLLAQPQLAMGVVVGVVVVAAAIATEIEAAKAKKPGCRCLCLKAGQGPDSHHGRVSSPEVCDQLCARDIEAGYTGSSCK
jgi:hypothetical protein